MSCVRWRRHGYAIAAVGFCRVEGAIGTLVELVRTRDQTVRRVGNSYARRPAERAFLRHLRGRSLRSSGGTRSAIERASSSDTRGSTITNSSPPLRATTSYRWHATVRKIAAVRRNASSPATWPWRSFKRFELVEIDDEHRQASIGTRARVHERSDVLVEASPIGEPGQRVEPGHVGKSSIRASRSRRVA